MQQLVWWVDLATTTSATTVNRKDDIRCNFTKQTAVRAQWCYPVPPCLEWEAALLIFSRMVSMTLPLALPKHFQSVHWALALVFGWRQKILGYYSHEGMAIIWTIYKQLLLLTNSYNRVYSTCAASVIELPWPHASNGKKEGASCPCLKYSAHQCNELWWKVIRQAMGLKSRCV